MRWARESTGNRKETVRPATQIGSKNCLGCKGVHRTFKFVSVIQPH